MKDEAALDEVIKSDSVALGSVKLSDEQRVNRRTEIVTKGCES